MEIRLRAFETSAMDNGTWSPSRSRCFNIRKTPPVNGTGCGCTPQSGTKRKIQFLQLNGVRPVSTVDVNTGVLLHLATVACHFPPMFFQTRCISVGRRKTYPAPSLNKHKPNMNCHPLNSNMWIPTHDKVEQRPAPCNMPSHETAEVISIVTYNNFPLL
jgi:hypothetical protein